MAVQQNKKSPSKRGMHRSHDHLGTPPTAVEPFLVLYPRVMYRMLQAQARRLRNANRWRS